MSDASDEKSVVPTNEGLDIARLAEPGTLAEGLRFLRDRIPGFVLLSTQEQRSLTRAAYLDPEFIEAGIRAAKAWDATAAKVGRSGEELSADADEIRR